MKIVDNIFLDHSNLYVSSHIIVCALLIFFLFKNQFYFLLRMTNFKAGVPSVFSLLADFLRLLWVHKENYLLW